MYAKEGLQAADMHIKCHAGIRNGVLNTISEDSGREKLEEDKVENGDGS